MTSLTKHINSSHGFSLIELILVITVGGLAFTMMAVYFSTAMTDSAEPVIRRDQSMSLTETAERISAHYREDTGADLNIIRTGLNTDPDQYGNDYTVETNEFITFTNGNDVPISGGDPEDVLKVRIRHNQTNETLTLVFTRH